MGSFTLSPLDIALLAVAVADPRRVAPDDADLALVAEQLGYESPRVPQTVDRRRPRGRYRARRSRKPPQ